MSSLWRRGLGGPSGGIRRVAASPPLGDGDGSGSGRGSEDDDEAASRSRADSNAASSANASANTSTHTTPVLRAASSPALSLAPPGAELLRPRSRSRSSLRSQSARALSDPPTTPVQRSWPRTLLYWLWLVLKTIVCVVTFFLGGFLCGGCCVPCASERKRHDERERIRPHHRRRRRRTSLLVPSATPASSESSSDPSATPPVPTAGVRPLGPGNASPAYESWTEDDDDEFEYEKISEEEEDAGVMNASGPVHEKWRHRHCGRCCSVRGMVTRGATLMALLLLSYLVFFVRVVPRAGVGGAGDALEVEFGRFGGGSFGGVPIPEPLHASLHAIIGQGARPGIKARRDGLRAHFPIVFIPGIVSTGLELWEGESCAKAHFRQRLWGSTLMLRSILLDSRCWLRHLSLDGQTGLDPEGIKLRPASGLEAADYLLGNFWIWAKLIENFADVGYDSNSMLMAPYDWRLSMKHLQLRDYYFSKLKATIELAKLSNHNRKVVLIAHSMGGQVTSYFLKWVESDAGGAGGPTWVADHIESFVGIGVPWLGVPKVFSALFSGEMRDTAELAPFLDYWRQRVVLSQADVLNIMRTFRSLPSMFPKGGNIVWGDSISAPDDLVEGEDDVPGVTPTMDYPGPEGKNRSFVTSQATAERKDKSKHEDLKRIRESITRRLKRGLGDEDDDDKEGEIEAGSSNGMEQGSNETDALDATDGAANASSPRRRRHSVSSTDVTHSPHSYLGQFLSFTSEVPWPFPNMTRVVERLVHDNEGHTDADSIDRLKARVEYAADTGEEPRLNDKDDRRSSGGANATISELNLEDAIHLLKLVAWPDVDFNDQLYSHGWGSRDDMETVNEAETDRRKQGKEGPRAGEGSGSGAAAGAGSEEKLPMESDTRASTEHHDQPVELLDLESPAVLNDQRRWANPLESSLPFAPHMKIFCFYGVGRQSERGYVYAKASQVSEWPSVTDILPSKEEGTEQIEGQKEDSATSKRRKHKKGKKKHHWYRHRRHAGGESEADPSHEEDDAGDDEEDTSDTPVHIGARAPTIPLFQLNTSYHHLEAHIRSGVKLADGDGTVPLVSLGYMCVDGWKHHRFNPAGLSVVTREYRDLNESLASTVLRSETSVDHVDIMGNSEMIADLLYIASIRVKTTSRPDSGDEKHGMDQPKRNSAEGADDGDADEEEEDDEDDLSDSPRFDRRLRSDVRREQRQQRHDRRLRAAGRTEPDERGASTTEQDTWKKSARDKRFKELPEDDDDEEGNEGTDAPAAGARKDKHVEDEAGGKNPDAGGTGHDGEKDIFSVRERSGLEGGHVASALEHPEGELTWSEVSERIYSRIRPIALRVRQRWEQRTGHQLEEADKPPPLNEALSHPTPRVREQMRREASATSQEPSSDTLPLKEGSPHESARRKEQRARASSAELDDAVPQADAETKASSLHARLKLDWTDDDEENFQSLLALREAAAQKRKQQRQQPEEPVKPDAPRSSSRSSPSSTSLPQAEREKRVVEEAVEEGLAARAEERAAKEEQFIQNSRRDHAEDERRRRIVQAAQKLGTGTQ